MTENNIVSKKRANHLEPARGTVHIERVRGAASRIERVRNSVGAIKKAPAKGYVVLRPRLHGGSIGFSDALKAFRQLRTANAN